MQTLQENDTLILDQIQGTKEYGLFKFRKDNRPIIPSNLKHIEESINKENLLHTKPILVNENFEVIDGQHRLLVAKKMNIPIYYSVQKNLSDDTLIRLNHCQKQWIMANYLDFYVSRDNEDYIKLKNFWQFSGLRLNQVFALFDLSCRKAGSDNGFREGKFKFPKNEKLFYDIVMKVKQFFEYIKHLPITPRSFLGTSAFMHGLRSFLMQDDVDFDYFMRKLQTHWPKLRPEATAQAYFSFFQKVHTSGRHKTDSAPVALEKQEMHFE